MDVLFTAVLASTVVWMFWDKCDLRTGTSHLYQCFENSTWWVLGLLATAQVADGSLQESSHGNSWRVYLLKGTLV